VPVERFTQIAGGLQVLGNQGPIFVALLDGPGQAPVQLGTMRSEP
jgi:hypothetical protein